MSDTHEHGGADAAEASAGQAGSEDRIDLLAADREVDNDTERYP